jgi:hypothetical protein
MLPIFGYLTQHPENIQRVSGEYEIVGVRITFVDLPVGAGELGKPHLVSGGMTWIYPDWLALRPGWGEEELVLPGPYEFQAWATGWHTSASPLF